MIGRLRWVQDHGFETSDESLSAFRVVFFVHVLATIGLPDSAWAAAFPDWLRTPPPGLPALFSSIPPYPLLRVVETASLICALLALVGYRTRWASIGFVVTSVLNLSIAFSFGKIDHGFLLLAAPAILSFSGWGKHYSVDAMLEARRRVPVEHLAKAPSAVRKNNSAAVSVLYCTFAMGFFTAGVLKILGGWLSLSYSSSRRWTVYYQVILDPDPALASLSLRLPNAIWELVDYATVLLEVGPLFLLLAPRVARRFVLALLPFHVGILLTLNINFAPLLLLYIPLVATTTSTHRVRSLALGIAALSRPVKVAAITGFLVVAAQTQGILSIFGVPANLFRESLTYQGTWLLLTCVLVIWFARRGTGHRIRADQSGAACLQDELNDATDASVPKAVLHDGGEVVGAQ